MRDIHKLLAFVFAGLVLAAGCGEEAEDGGLAEDPPGDDESDTRDDPEEAEHEEQVSITIAKSQDAVTDLHAYAPVELCLFDEQGINAEIVVFDSGSDARNAFIGGAAEFVIIGVEHAQRMHSEGLDARAGAGPKVDLGLEQQLELVGVQIDHDPAVILGADVADPLDQRATRHAGLRVPRGARGNGRGGPSLESLVRGG